MGRESDSLWHELSAMADAFADLGRRLLAASRELHATGVLPPAPLFAEVARLDAAMTALRERTCQLAGSLGVAAPTPGALETLKGLATFLERVCETEDEADFRAPRSRCSTGFCG